MKTAILAALGVLLCLNAAEARRARPVDLTPVPVAGAMVDDRYPHMRIPEAYGTARAQQPQARAHHRHKHRRQAVPVPRPRPKTLARGLVEEVQKALPARGLTGIVPRLAEKASEIVGSCGSRVISAKRQTYVAGTRRISLHASGKAVDISGNPRCIYAHLRSWPGGYSVDYARVKHVHVSYDPTGRREWGARFVHGGRTMSARRHHRHHRRRA